MVADILLFLMLWWRELVIISFSKYIVNPHAQIHTSVYSVHCNNIQKIVLSDLFSVLQNLAVFQYLDSKMNYFINIFLNLDYKQILINQASETARLFYKFDKKKKNSDACLMLKLPREVRLTAKPFFLKRNLVIPSNSLEKFFGHSRI